MATAKLEKNPTAFNTGRHLIAGRYRMQSRIGQGRLGQIFSAIDESYEKLGVEQRVAIQIIPESIVGNNNLFNKLNLGYTVLKAGAHPNIVNFLHFGRDAEFGFVAMELLGGASLRLLLDDAETLQLEEVKPVIRGIGEALRLLHAKDMVHGNVTSRNVFITDDLEVRLLDVVPLDSANTIFRGAAMSEPFSRCTVEDDVFSLACLACEMLTGKHPFNYSPPTEARLAGLEADRIDSLTDSEWSALHRALSFDREQRTSSVADFMRDFGINGIERLRPTLDQAHISEPAPLPALEEGQPVAPVQGVATVAPTVDVDSISLQENWPPDARPNHRRTRPVRAVFLGMLLAGLSVWSSFGQPEELIVSLIGYIDKSMNVGLTDRGDGITDVWTTDPGRSVTTERVSQNTGPTVAAPAATGEATQADVETKQPETRPAATNEENVAEPEQPTDQPAIATSPESGNTTVTNDSATNNSAGEISADTDTKTNPNPMQTETRVLVTEPVVSVSEGDGAARIVLQRNEYSARPLIWWTSDNTANADQDFISVQGQIVAGPSTEDGDLLHIPLVNDSLAEPQESFFVYLGLRNIQQGKIEQISAVRVDIIDDDLP